MNVPFILFLTISLGSAHMVYDPNDDCFVNQNYKQKTSTENFFVFTKHLNDTNCVKLDTHRDQDFDFYVVDKDKNPHKISIDPISTQKFTRHGVEVRTVDVEGEVALEDPNTHEIHVLSKDEVSRVILSIPFEYKLGVIKSNYKDKQKETIKIYLDTRKVKLHPYAMTTMDYVFYYLDLINALIIVDLGIIVKLAIPYTHLARTAHKKIMWVFLSLHIVSLLYFLFRYQLYFVQQRIFFYYFLISVVIDVFQIFNTSWGVYLQTSIHEKHIYQDVLFYKSLHRWLGYLSFLLIKVNILIKYLMFKYIIETRLQVVMLLIIFLCPAMWTCLAVYRLSKWVYVKTGRQQKPVLEKRTINFETRLSFADLLLQIKTESSWFVLENNIYVMNPKFIHPGGNFIIEKINKRHVTKYFYGICAVEAFPFRNLKFNHGRVLLDSQIVKEKNTLPSTNLFAERVEGHLTSLDWHESMHWFIEDFEKLCRNVFCIFLWSDQVNIRRGSIDESVENFGKYFIIKMKGAKAYKHSYVVLSQNARLAYLKSLYFNKLLLQAKHLLVKPKPDAETNCKIELNCKAGQDFVHSDLTSKFLQNYSAVPPEVAEEAGNVEKLPIVISSSHQHRFLPILSDEDKVNINRAFEARAGPVKLMTRLKMAVGGPFGFDHILSEGKTVYLYMDDWGVSVMQDLAFVLLRDWLAEDAVIEREPGWPKLPRLALGFVHLMTDYKLNKFNDYLVAMGLLEKLARKQRVELICTIERLDQVAELVEKNLKQIEEADYHLISAGFSHASVFYSVLTDKVHRHNVILL